MVSTSTLVAAYLSIFLLVSSISPAEGAELAQVVRVLKDGQCSPELAESIAQYLKSQGQLAVALSAEVEKGCQCGKQLICIWHLLQETQARYGIDVSLSEGNAEYRVDITIYDNKDRTSGHYRNWDLKLSEIQRELPKKAGLLLKEYRNRRPLTPLFGVSSEPTMSLREKRRRALDIVGATFSTLATISLIGSIVLVLQNGKSIDAQCARLPYSRPCVLDTRPAFISGFVSSALFTVSAGLTLGIR